jgi:hypothetical protein
VETGVWGATDRLTGTDRVRNFHCCLQYQGVIQQRFVQKSGINEWADTNNIIVLYRKPPARARPIRPGAGTGGVTPAHDRPINEQDGWEGPNKAPDAAIAEVSAAEPRCDLAVSCEVSRTIALLV